MKLCSRIINGKNQRLNSFISQGFSQCEQLWVDGSVISLKVGFTNMSTTNLDEKLYEAATDGNLAAVKELVARGANLNATSPRKEDDGGTIFTCAMFLVHSHDYVRELLQLGAKADVPDCEGGTPLSLAVMGNDFNLVRILLKAGANPNTIAYKTEEPQTALDVAYGDYCVQDTKADKMNLDAIVQLLKEHGGKEYRELKKEKTTQP